MSQILLEISILLAYRNSLSKYGDIKTFFLQNTVTFAYLVLYIFENLPKNNKAPPQAQDDPPTIVLVFVPSPASPESPSQDIHRRRSSTSGAAVAKEEEYRKIPLPKTFPRILHGRAGAWT